MSEQNTEATVPQVKDKRLIPPGILPKNLQAWVLSGIALVMVAVIAFTGPKAPKPHSTLPTPALTAIDPNQGQIEEYRKRIEEETRKLQLEQAALAHNQEELAADASKAIAGAGRDRGPYGGSFSRDASPSTNAIQAEKAKREYESLFASPVALSYRKETPSLDRASSERMPSERISSDRISSDRVSEEPATPDALSRLLPFYAALAAMQPSGGGTAGRSDGQPLAALVQAAAGKVETLPVKDTGSGSANDRKHRLYEGTLLETVLTNRLDGSFSGPVNCMVTTNVYSHDGQHLLIPQGSRVLGEVHKVESFGQSRLAVVFHRLIMPDGYSVSLDQFQALNQIGETGLRDKVNHHYLQVFGVSVAIGAIAGLGQANTRTGFDQSGIDTYEQGVASSLSQSALRILDRYLNVLPTMTIMEGHRVKVYLAADLLLPAYDQHRTDS
jgi:type IV secretion system protein VirB10